MASTDNNHQHTLQPEQTMFLFGNEVDMQTQLRMAYAVLAYTDSDCKVNGEITLLDSNAMTHKIKRNQMPSTFSEFYAQYSDTKAFQAELRFSEQNETDHNGALLVTRGVAQTIDKKYFDVFCPDKNMFFSILPLNETRRKPFIDYMHTCLASDKELYFPVC